MRWLGWLLVLLAAAGWLAIEIQRPEAPAASQRPLDCWRRTSDGWQRATWLPSQRPIHKPALHPVVVGLFELLFSLAALLGFPSPVNRWAKRDFSARPILMRPCPRRATE